MSEVFDLEIEAPVSCHFQKNLNRFGRTSSNLKLHRHENFSNFVCTQPGYLSIGFPSPFKVLTQRSIAFGAVARVAVPGHGHEALG